MENISGGEKTELPVAGLLQNFYVKTFAVMVAAIIVVNVASSAVKSMIDSQIPRGGPEFWKQVERRLYALADAPDMPPEKQQKIAAALHKLAVKYRPFFEALSVERPERAR